MLKVRVIPTMLYKDVGLVKGVGFDSWRRVGSAMQAVKVYNMRGVDEVVLVDITATTEGRSPDFCTIDDLADDCFMPLTVGGGVRQWEDVRGLLRVGADKVAINSAAVATPAVIEESAKRFGSQCIVASIDYRRANGGGYFVYTHSGTKKTEIDPVEMALEAERRGAGEILLTSIDRDGSMEGYDIDGIRRVATAVSIPVIASGGAGCAEHMVEALKEGHATDVAAASIFHFTHLTPMDCKRCLRENGYRVRMN